MLLNVKIVGSCPPQCSTTEPINVEALPSDLVEQLKAKLEKKLNLGSVEQKLLFRGKPLQDGASLSSYQLVDGAKLHLMLKDQSTLSAVSKPISGQKNIEKILEEALRKHIKNEEDVKKVVKQFLTRLDGRVASMNLDDIERLAQNLQETNALNF